MAQSRSRSNVVRYLTVVLSQGSADAFDEGSVDTGIVPEDGFGLQVKSIDFWISNSLAAVSADCSLQWSLSRDTKTTVVGLEDPDAIVYDGWSASLTTSGQILIPGYYRYPQIEGIYIVEPTIYAQIDGTATGVQITAAGFRIYYEAVPLSEVDILRVLQNA